LTPNAVRIRSKNWAKLGSLRNNLSYVREFDQCLDVHLTQIELQVNYLEKQCRDYLSAILVGGLLLNALLGWWWADPVAALIMVPIIVKEGIEGLRGETCCDDECH